MSLSLLKFRNLVRQAQNLEIPLGNRNAVYQVLGVHMYLSDRKIGQVFQLSEDFKSFPFLYDIVLSDGQATFKCLLEINLGCQVQFSELVAGVKVKVLKARCVTFDQNDIIVLQEIEILKDVELISAADYKLPLLTDANQREKNKLPLLGGRSSYLNVWATSVPFGEEWHKPDSCLTLSQTLRDFASNSEMNRDTLEGIFTSYKIIPKPYPLLLVKILLKRNLHHYGTDQKDKPCPFQGYFVVGDHTAICNMVIWDSANVGTYNMLNPGDLITLKGYLITSLSTKRMESLGSLSMPTNWPPIMPMELKVNYARNISRCSQAEIKSFHGNNITFPEITYCFEDHEMLRNAIGNTYVDIVGMVIHASHLNRRKMQASPEYCVYQWLLIRDETNHPVWIYYYTCNLAPIYPNCVVAFQRLLVVRTTEPENEDLPPSQFKFLSFQVDSKIFYMDYRKLLWGPGLDEPKLKECLAWAKEGKDNVRLTSTVGGLQEFPFMLTSLEEYFQSMMTENEQKEVSDKKCLENWINHLKSKERWQKLIHKLYYKERKTTLFHGRILRVDYVENGTVIKLVWQATPNRHVPGHYDKVLQGINLLAFPWIYESPAKKKLMNSLKFKAFSVELLNSQHTNIETQTMSALSDAKKVGKGVYVIVIGNEGENWSVPTIYFPEANKQQPGSLLDLLSSGPDLDLDKDWRDFDSSQLYNMISSTAINMHGIDYLFALDLLSLDRFYQFTILRRLYHLPSELPGKTNQEMISAMEVETASESNVV